MQTTLQYSNSKLSNSLYDHFMTIFKNYIHDDHNIKEQIIQQKQAEKEKQDEEDRKRKSKSKDVEAAQKLSEKNDSTNVRSSETTGDGGRDSMMSAGTVIVNMNNNNFDDNKLSSLATMTNNESTNNIRMSGMVGMCADNIFEPNQTIFQSN